jgi:hypothetical protein
LRGLAVDVADLDGDRVGEHPADPGDGAEQRDVAVVGAEPAELALAVADLAVELVDQAQAGLERAVPRLRQIEPGEQLAAADTEQIGDRTWLAVREQDGVYTLFQARAATNEVQTPASAFGAYQRIGQRDRRHQLTAWELGQHPGVDPVGLAGQRRQSLHLLRIGDLDLPTRELEPIVHEPRPVHRLNCRADRLAVTCETLAQATQTVGIRWRRTDLDRRTVGVEQVEVEALAAEIQSWRQRWRFRLRSKQWGLERGADPTVATATDTIFVALGVS